MSGAFRLRDKALRERWYPHSPDPKLPVTYGLTERHREELPGARLIACAGLVGFPAVLMGLVYPSLFRLDWFPASNADGAAGTTRKFQQFQQF